ncbi:MAG: FtsQ-type POTRA domain-containing protein [Ruminococcaceae bacterium]|nr:FtsQ-type POTRA domain-containing protein [Oscillospiraceae bacterium]
MVQKAKNPSLQVRHNKRRSKRIRQMKIRRFIFFTTLACIILSIILFFTPLFKIRAVEISGNEKLTTEELMQIVEEAQGENLFRFRTSRLKKELLEIPYVQSVEIERKIFRPRLLVQITEGQPIAYVACVKGYAAMDAEGKVLEFSESAFSGIPEIFGLNASAALPGEVLIEGESEQFEVALECLHHMQKNEILPGVRNLSVADISNITFHYEDRLDAVCGSAVDLEKKIAVFKSSVNSNRLNENSRGTLDLSTTGRAIYTP